jgi:curved DNA-binding protein CbpA
MTRDLYRALEISSTASDEEVKRAYRRLALLYHPDRNRAEEASEDRFKEANYAYSILGDREKRKRYDLYREFVILSTRWGVPPSRAQERVLAEFFLDPKFPGLGKWLDEILRDRGFSDEGNPFWGFSRTTLRFLHHVYQESRRQRRPNKKGRSGRIASYSKGVFEKAGGVLNPFGPTRRQRGRSGTEPLSENPGRFHWGRARGNQTADLEWTLPLTQEEATQGTRLTLSLFRDSRWDRLSLRVPPGTREGVRLRVRNKGNRVSSSGETGDLYLRVMIR